MALLAEPKRKMKYGLDPQNTQWSNDTSKFGQRLMEKMGWEQGKGLGASESGMTEHIKASYKWDQRGLGSTPKSADAWVAHQDDFNDLLKKLNSGRTDEPPEEKDKATQIKDGHKRYYGRFARGRVQKLRTTEDLDCIFGRRKNGSEPTTPSNQSAANSGDEDSTEGGNQKDENVEHNHGLTTVTSTTSVQDYFAQKMKEMKARRAAGQTGSGVEGQVNGGQGKEEKSKTEKCVSVYGSVGFSYADTGDEGDKTSRGWYEGWTMGENNGDGVEEGSGKEEGGVKSKKKKNVLEAMEVELVEEVKSGKKEKKSKKKKKEKKEETESCDDKTADDDIIVEEEKIDVGDKEKKSKKNKKKQEIMQSCGKKSIEDVSIVEMIPLKETNMDDEERQSKKKKKDKRRSTDSGAVEQTDTAAQDFNTVTETVREDEVEKISKKSKKRKQVTDLEDKDQPANKKMKGVSADKDEKDDENKEDSQKSEVKKRKKKKGSHKDLDVSKQVFTTAKGIERLFPGSNLEEIEGYADVNRLQVKAAKIKRLGEEEEKRLAKQQRKEEWEKKETERLEEKQKRRENHERQASERKEEKQKRKEAHERAEQEKKEKKEEKQRKRENQERLSKEKKERKTTLKPRDISEDLRAFSKIQTKGVQKS